MFLGEFVLEGGLKGEEGFPSKETANCAKMRDLIGLCPKGNCLPAVFVNYIWTVNTAYNANVLKLYKLGDVKSLHFQFRENLKRSYP